MSAPSTRRPQVFQQPLSVGPRPPAPPPPGPPAPRPTPGPWILIPKIKDKLKRPLIDVHKKGELKLPFINARGSLDLELG